VLKCLLPTNRPFKYLICLWLPTQSPSVNTYQTPTTTTTTKSTNMTTSIPQGTLLDVLKKKMRQTKEEMEKYKDECEEFHKRLQLEVVRREEVSLGFNYKLQFTSKLLLLLVYKFMWQGLEYILHKKTSTPAGRAQDSQQQQHFFSLSAVSSANVSNANTYGRTQILRHMDTNTNTKSCHIRTLSLAALFRSCSLGVSVSISIAVSTFVVLFLAGFPVAHCVLSFYLTIFCYYKYQFFFYVCVKYTGCF